ncbi:hypothetical protein R3P38DRAFT_2909533 [Favolaschia claudopus]|uniref:Uncharacterized protein n=1 Tax=Favolaschia claudopus TaxID=2862362 RepID=A0AAW0CAT6_9AGAR
MKDKTLLTHRLLQVWLADHENKLIPHGEVTVSANTLTTSVSLPKGTEYAVHWRNCPGSLHTAFCEIFVHSKKTRVATHFMHSDKPDTQARSSLGRISPLVTGTQNNDWLKAPTPSKQAYVELHIRRATGTPIHECHPDPKDPKGHIDEIDIDIIDDADEGKDPFIIFKFQFIVESPQSTVPQKRKPPLDRSTRSTQDKEASPDSEDHDDLLERLAAAKEEEKKLDAEIEHELQGIKRRIMKKKRLLGKGD